MTSSNLTQKIKQGICAYCGAAGDMTIDHVIPQCLWSGRVPKAVPLVDACPQCNNIWKSGNDTYLRDLLVNDRDALQSPRAQKPQAAYIRSMLRNQSEMDHDIRNHSKIVTRQTPSGLLVSYFVSEVAEKRTRDIMSLMVRGLHYYYLHEPLSKDTIFRIGRLRTMEQIEAISSDIAGFTGEYYRGASVCVGDGTVFSCAYVEMSRDDHTTLWRLNFYGNVIFAVMTNAIQIKYEA